jgi:hypothetical protein
VGENKSGRGRIENSDAKVFWWAFLQEREREREKRVIVCPLDDERPLGRGGSVCLVPRSLGLVAYAPMPTEVEHSGTDDRTPRILSIYQRLDTLDIQSKT